MPYKLPYEPIKEVQFQPWVGKNYSSRNPKLLVLGMSHYLTDSYNAPHYFATNDVIANHPGRFLTNVVATSIGHLPTNNERAEFWDSAAFYNYIQQFVGNSPRRHHAYKLWKDSEPAFAEVLLRLKPQLVFVIGEQNWGNIANLNGWSGNNLGQAPESKYADTWWYPVGNGEAALAFHVKHTAAGYNFRRFAALFHEAEQVAQAGWQPS